MALSPAKFYRWKQRYGRANEHNGKIPRDFWLEEWERQAILDFHDLHPLEGYRRLTEVLELNAQGAGTPVPTKTEPIGTTERVRIRPLRGWRGNKTFKLRLLPALADAGGNAWNRTFEIEFKTSSGQALDTAELANVRDIARLGSLLFVAADQEGLFVFDASDPKNLVPYVYRLVGGVRQPLGIPFPGGGSVRGLDVAESHGLLIVAGGGNAAFGQLKIYDPLALDPEAIAADPDNVELLTAAFKGSTIVSDLVGGSGTNLPAGTPEAVEVVTDDLTGQWIAGQAPPAEMEVTVDPPALPPYTLTVSGTAAPASTVTIRTANAGRRHPAIAVGSGALGDLL